MTNIINGAGAAPQKSTMPLRKTILWVIVGAVGLSAIVSILWVMLGDRMGSLVLSAFGTIALVTLFSVFSLIEVNLGERRPQWVTVSRIIALAVALLAGTYFLWMKGDAPIDSYYYSEAADNWDRFSLFVFVLIPVTQLAMLHLSLTARRMPKYDPRARGVAVSSIIAVCVVATLLTLSIVLYREDLGDLFWRSVAALSIVASVLTILPPVIHAIKNPKPRVVAPPAPPVQQFAHPQQQFAYPQQQPYYDPMAQQRPRAVQPPFDPSQYPFNQPVPQSQPAPPPPAPVLPPFNPNQ